MGVHTLTAGVDELLALDPAEMDDDTLHALVVATQRQTHRLAAARARLVAAWDGRQVWAGDGSRSGGHRLARQCSMSVAAGKREVRRGRALQAMPLTADALAGGSLSPEHVDLLSAANDGHRASLFADHEAALVEQCKALRFADARRAVDYWRQRADGEAAEDDAARQVEARTVTASRTFDGMVDVRALLDPVGGAAFADELNRLTEAQRRADLADGVIRTATQRRADALVEMAIRSRTAPNDGLRPRPLLSILVGEATLAHVCELATGVVLAPGQLLPLLSETDIERIVFDGPDRVMSVSKRRTFTGAVRRAIEVRDRHCQHPSGCDEPAPRCDVDHVIPRRAGGSTSQENGRLLCWPHNRNDRLRNAHPTTTGSQQPPPPPTLGCPPSQPEADDHPDCRASPDAA